MFIVAMTLSVLAAVGVYALAAASNEVRTAGNGRQNAQTHYLSQYGVLAATQELAATKAQLYLGLMLSQPDQNCISLPGVTTLMDPMVQACRRVGATELATGAGWSTTPTAAYTGSVPYTASVLTPGSLGPIPLKADFFIEFTAPTMTSAASLYALSSQFCFIQFTATSVGLTQPQTGSGSSAATYFGGEGLEMERARLVAGPITCPR